MKTLFTNCKIYDGSGSAPLNGEILIEKEKIIAVGSSLNRADATIIDLGGKSISSGFFDAHSHNDWFAIKKSPQKYFEPFLRQGITSFIAGNCGLSETGFTKDSNHISKIGAGLFFYNDVTGEYGTVKEFFAAIDNNTPLNIATLIGHCSARTSVSGYENKQLNASEKSQMLGILEQGLKDGACGISLGLMYEPGIYSSTEELKDVAKLAEKYDKPLTVHPRACSAVSMAYPNPFGRPHILRALDELVEVTRGLSVKLEYSHAIFVGKNSFKCVDELVSILDKLRKDGVDAMFDIYSETCGVSVITVVMPAWYQALPSASKKAFFNKLKFKTMAVVSKKLLGFEFSDMVIAYLGEKGKQFEGKNVAQIAKELGKSELETYIYLCDISDYKGRINMYQYSTPAILSKLSKNKHVLYMTDAWVEDNGVQNTAVYDCFPKFLHLSLNGSGDSMPNTIRKMTGAVADRFSIAERGYVKEGYYADLTVFDEEKLKSGTPDQMRSFGIEQVYVNGKLILNGDKVNSTAFKTSGHAMKATNK